MAKFKPASPQQLKEIKDSVWVAVRELEKTGRNIHKPKRGSGSKTNSDVAPKQLLIPGDARCKEILKRPTVRRQIAKALDKGDVRFFVQFGRLLSQTFSFLQDLKLYMPPLVQQFMVGHWAERSDGLPELCYLTPSDIAIIFSLRFGFEPSEDAIVKIRQRLKLKPFRGRKLSAKYVVTDPETGTIKISFPELDK